MRRIRVIPSAHALADRFGLFDNFYDEGTLSADGHNRIVQAEANDYVEEEFGAFYGSYPTQRTSASTSTTASAGRGRRA